MFTVSLYAQIPVGYYDSAAGLSGAALRNALHDIISNNFQSVSYSNLWSSYLQTDKKSNGKVWDMYSDIPGGTAPYEYIFGTNQCGTYNSEADCYNREHTVPASWFNDNAPMYSDVFMVVPTDGWVNNKRGNYPYGEIGSVSWTSQNGSKVGSSNFTGYSGTVFEPIDSFKGDFARIYFYVAVRYKDEISSWSGESFSGDNLSSWTENMMLQWHASDPVSQKEIDRNNAVYSEQNNRNPFVDNPSWVYSIWGPSAGLKPVSVFYKVNLFPNPANQFCKISFNDNMDFQNLKVFDTEGRQVFTSDYCLVFDTQAWPNGFYVVRLLFEKAVVYKELIISH